MNSVNSLPDIRKVRMIDEPIGKVWQGIASAEGIAAWSVPNDFQPIEGHSFHMEMHEPQGRTPCLVTVVQPPNRLTYTFCRDWTWTFELKEQDGQTELAFIWSGWDADKSSEIGIPHTTLHSQMLNGTNVLIKRLARSIPKLDDKEESR